CGFGRRLWCEESGPGLPPLRELMPLPQAEVYLEGEGLTGTLDLVALDPRTRTIFVLDWKSGWATDWDYAEQLRGYAWLSLQGDPEAADQVWAGVLNVRRGVLDARVYSPSQLAAWHAQTAKRLADGTYRAGAHCSRCPRAAGCPAVEKWLAQ